LEVYVHRSGRTGRAGKSGSSITIVHGREGGRIRDLEKITGKKFNLQQVPTGAEIGRLHVVKQTEALLDADVKTSVMGPLPAEIHLLFDGLSREQIIDQWIQWSFRQNVREDANHSDINVSAGKSSPRDRNDRSERSDRGDRGDRSRDSRSSDGGRRSSRDGERRSERPSFDRSAERPSFDRGSDRGRGERDQVRARDFDRPVKRNDNENFVEIEVNIGATQDMKPNRIMGLINEVTGDSSIKFGRIDIKQDKSFIGVEADYAKHVAKALDGFQFGSRKLKASFSDGAPKRRSEGGFERRSEGGLDRRSEGGYERRSEGSSDRRSEGGYERRSEGSSDRRSAGGYEKPKYDKPKYEERKSGRKEGFDKKPRRRRL
jgi:ATP-dependent RNA helicase DeaD